MNFNIEIGKMLEIISKDKTARRFAYTAMVLALILATCLGISALMVAYSYLM